ncbi:MAG: hypothetical protein CW691_04290 [Candidatus Bathyarchaeum sp.]|nr:MAG: hypothetical protein CW691_04290 [Candidatus Bathyarchaeum sp.]
MREKSAVVMLLVLCVALFAFSQIEEVKAQGTIYIRSDGSVEGTDKIQRNGKVYTFTGNIFGEIKVQRSNFVLDGAGFTLQGNWTGFNPDGYVLCKGIDFSNNRGSEPSRHEISNVTVKNLRIMNFTRGIECVNSNNHSIISCYILNCARSINQPSNVLITNNTLESGIFIDYTRADNVITKNNMMNYPYSAASLVGVFLAEQPTVYMNYWSDYNGTDADGDGIGDTPYTINEDNQDNYPLMEPVIVPECPFFPIEAPWAAGGFFPEPDSIDVSVDAVVCISFGRPPSIVELSISPEVDVKERTIEHVGLAGALHTFYFSEELQPSTTYTVTMLFGSPNSTRTWKFTTTSETPETPPADKDDLFDLTPYYGWLIIIVVISTVLIGLYFSRIRENRNKKVS